MQTGTWYHVAFSYDGTNATIYLNGVADGTGAFGTGTGILALDKATMISDRVDASQLNDGRVDEPRISSFARSAPWIAAEYKNQGPNTFTTFGAPQNSDSYSYRRKISFDNSAQAENLVNFPVDVKANNSSLAWSSLIQADMDDVIFVDADDTTPLSFEWETKVPAGDSIAWVKVPQVNASSSADYVYMYYGNPSTSSQETAFISIRINELQNTENG